MHHVVHVERCACRGRAAERGLGTETGMKEPKGDPTFTRVYNESKYYQIEMVMNQQLYSRLELNTEKRGTGKED